MPQYTPQLEKKYPVRVPGNIIRTKYYDGDGEIFATAGVPLIIDRQPVKPPSIGVWSLLETFESPFVNDFPKCTPIDVFRALYINEYRNGHPWKFWRPNAAREVREWIDDGGPVLFNIEDKSTWLPWDYKVGRYAYRLKFDICNTGHLEEIRIWFDLSFNGFEMIPKRGGGSSGYWFGAETIGSIIAAIGECVALTPEQIMWDLPLCAVGHIAAQKCAQSDPNSGVARPKCSEHMKELFLQCIERAKLGKLHPWQKADPLGYGLDELQAYLHPELIDHYRSLGRAVADRKRSERKEYMESISSA